MAEASQMLTPLLEPIDALLPICWSLWTNAKNSEAAMIWLKALNYVVAILGFPADRPHLHSAQAVIARRVG